MAIHNSFIVIWIDTHVGHVRTEWKLAKFLGTENKFYVKKICEIEKKEIYLKNHLSC